MRHPALDPTECAIGMKLLRRSLQMPYNSTVELRTNADAADAARLKIRHRFFVANPGQDVDRDLDAANNIFDIRKRHKRRRKERIGFRFFVEREPRENLIEVARSGKETIRAGASYEGPPKIARGFNGSNDTLFCQPAVEEGRSRITCRIFDGPTRKPCLPGEADGFYHSVRGGTKSVQ